jgi:hypothetical protein
MLRQKKLPFIKAIGTNELSPVLPRELRKAMAAAKKKVLASTAPTGGAVGDAPTFLDQPNACKGKAEEISSADCTNEPASRRPAPGHVFEEGPEVQDTTGELAAQSSRQLGSAEGRLAYATVVAKAASLHKPSGPHKSTANGSVSAEPLPRLRQSLGACLSKKCPDLCVACLMTPLQTPKWQRAVPPHRRAAQQDAQFYCRCSRHPCLPGLVAGVLPWRPNGPIKKREIGRTINS